MHRSRNTNLTVAFSHFYLSYFALWHSY